MAERLQVEETREKVEQTKGIQSEAASSTQDPEFGPVWPLPSPPHQRSAILKPLLFPEPAKEDRSYLLYRSRDLPLPCVLCEKCYGDGVREGEREEGVWEAARDQLLRHLLDNHQIVIHQVDHIASLRRSVFTITILDWPILVDNLPYDQYWTGPYCDTSPMAILDWPIL